MLKDLLPKMALEFRSEKSQIQGFSLIELVIVIAIVGVLTLMVMPYFGSFLQYAALKNDSMVLVSDLKSYRQLAIIEHVNYKFAFDINSDSYTIEQRDATTNDLLQTIATVELESDITQATDTIFQPKGNAFPESNIELRGENPSDTISITVHSTTGLVEVTE